MKFIKDIIGEKREQGPLSPAFEPEATATQAPERDVLTAILAESRAKSQSQSQSQSQQSQTRQSQSPAPAPLTLEPAARVGPEAQAAVNSLSENLRAAAAPATPEPPKEDALAAFLAQHGDELSGVLPVEDTPEAEAPAATGPEPEATPDGVERPYRIFTRRNRTKMLQLEAAAKAASHARGAAGEAPVDPAPRLPQDEAPTAPEAFSEPEVQPASETIAPAPFVEPAPFAPELPPEDHAEPDADQMEDSLIADLMAADSEPMQPDAELPLQEEPEVASHASPAEGPVLGAAFPEPAFAETAAAAGVDLGQADLGLPMGRAGRVKTRLLGFDGDLGVGDPFAQPGTTEGPNVSQFPVGWLVVVEGPGRGAGFTLFAGVSVIGRGEGQTIRLDYGDSSISRDQHAAIAYDPEQQGFFIGHGGKANLVRRNGRPVLSTEALGAGDLIRVGETTLRFVPLCGPEFSWQGQAATGGAHFG